MMHAEKDSSRKLAFFLSLRLFNFEALLESFVNHVYGVKALKKMEMSIHFFFDIFDILHFLHWWTSQGQNIEQMASKLCERYNQ